MDQDPQSAEDMEDYFSLDQNRQRQVLPWKLELYRILRGDRATEIIHSLGTAADYIRTKFSGVVQRDNFVEALDETLKEVTFAVLSASALNHLLDLIIEFHPRSGFTSLVSYLRIGGVAETFVPVGTAIEVDLQQKMVDALSGYFEEPALNAKDPAFLVYVRILRQQMRMHGSAYAASELLRLEVLQPDSPEFVSLIEDQPEFLWEIFADLSHYASSGYGIEVMQLLFVACLALGKDISTTLLSAAEASGAVVEPTVHVHPIYPSETLEAPPYILRLASGTEIPLNLTAQQVEMIEKCRYTNDIQEAINGLLQKERPQQRSEEIATDLFAKSCLMGVQGIETFSEAIRYHGASLISDLVDNRVYIQHDDGQIDVDLDKIVPVYFQTYIRYLKSRNHIPDDPVKIQQAIKTKVEEEERAFAVPGN